MTLLISPSSFLNDCLLCHWDPRHFWFCSVSFPGSSSLTCILVCLRSYFIFTLGSFPGQSHPFYGGSSYSMLWTPNPTPLVLTCLRNYRLDSNCLFDISQGYLKLNIFKIELIIFPLTLLFFLLMVNSVYDLTGPGVPRVNIVSWCMRLCRCFGWD